MKIDESDNEYMHMAMMVNNGKTWINDKGEE